MPKKWFTLVELIVVITILAILGTIAFISLQWYSANARDSRRLADVWNIKKWLELFLLQTERYPLPDNSEEVTYSWEIVWYQWTLWDNVVKQLSRNLKEKPTDPSTESEYVYSTLESKVEYEVVAVYEKNITQNSITTKANANTNYVKVDGTYNTIYVQTTNFVIPTPSIVTAETLPLTLDATNIKSQVVTGRLNTPSNGWITAQTWWLDIVLSVYTWSITATSTQQEKLDAMTAIQNAYTWTLLSVWDTYQTLLSQTSTWELVAYVDNTVLNDPSQWTAPSTQWGGGWVTVNGTCWSDNGQNLWTTPTNLCTTWTASSVTDNWVWSTYTWSCDGSNGWSNANCSANHISLNCDASPTYVYNTHTYNIPQANNGVWSTTTSSQVSENNGVFTYDLSRTCTAWSYTGLSESAASNVSCDVGYNWNGSSCALLFSSETITTGALTVYLINHSSSISYNDQITFCQTHFPGSNIPALSQLQGQSVSAGDYAKFQTFYGTNYKHFRTTTTQGGWSCTYKYVVGLWGSSLWQQLGYGYIGGSWCSGTSLQNQSQFICVQ
jgi:prepilin-type N-terminal cleavage/methylation domain-containing protein